MARLSDLQVKLRRVRDLPRVVGKVDGDAAAWIDDVPTQGDTEGERGYLDRAKDWLRRKADAVRDKAGKVAAEARRRIRVAARAGADASRGIATDLVAPFREIANMFAVGNAVVILFLGLGALLLMENK